MHIHYDTVFIGDLPIYDRTHYGDCAAYFKSGHGKSISVGNDIILHFNKVEKVCAILIANNVFIKCLVASSNPDVIRKAFNVILPSAKDPDYFTHGYSVVMEEFLFAVKNSSVI